MYPSVILVYVQLGKNPSPTLQHYSKVNFKVISNSVSVLITDNPIEHSDFPGKIISYSGQYAGPGIRKYLSSNKAYSNIAGGYWRFTMERLFSLLALLDHYPMETPVIHIESDVLLLLNDDVLNSLKLSVHKTSVPRYSSEDGIASVMFAPSLRKLSSDITALDELLYRNIKTRSDMSLLGLGLKEGILDELPSSPDKAINVIDNIDMQGKRYVFDGLAYGQYLFGQDPVHTSNKRISGFINKEFPINLSKLKWKLTTNSNSMTPYFVENGIEYHLATLHMHSKLEIDPQDSGMWEICLQEANGEVDRILGPYVPDLIHTIKSSYIDRIRILVQRGVTKSILLGFKRRIIGVKEK
jgi:hypothetical protein